MPSIPVVRVDPATIARRYRLSPRAAVQLVTVLQDEFRAELRIIPVDGGADLVQLRALVPEVVWARALRRVER